MNKLVVGLLALVALVTLAARPAQAQGPIGYPGSSWQWHSNHHQMHAEAQRRAMDRGQLHHQMHMSGPMTTQQHQILHNHLEHEAFHDHLEHRTWHGNNHPHFHGGFGHPGFGHSGFGHRGFGHRGIGIQTRGFGIWLGR